MNNGRDLHSYGIIRSVNGNSFPMFPIFMAFKEEEDGTDRLSRNVGKELPQFAA